MKKEFKQIETGKIPKGWELHLKLCDFRLAD